MPRLHLPRSLYHLFVYDFPYDFFGIVGAYKLRRMCLHCLRSLCDFFRGHTRTKPYRDLADIARQSQGCRAVIVSSSRPPYINRTMPVYGRPCSFSDAHLNRLSKSCDENRVMKRLVFLLNMVPRYGIDDTLQRVTLCKF